MHLLGRECQYTSQERPCQHHFSIFSAQFFEPLVFSCFLLKSRIFSNRIFVSVFAAERYNFSPEYVILIKMQPPPPGLSLTFIRRTFLHAERHPPARHRAAALFPPAAGHGHHRPAGRTGLFCTDPRGQPPHPRFARHPLHRRERHLRLLRVRRLAGVRDDRGRHPWPCAGTGLCPEQRRRQLSGRALPEGHERHL